MRERWEVNEKNGLDASKNFSSPKIVLDGKGAHVIGVPYPAEYFAFSFLFLIRKDA
jgi:hypothetical protein